MFVKFNKIRIELQFFILGLSIDFKMVGNSIERVKDKSLISN